MTTYHDVPLNLRSLSREELEHLVASTRDLLSKRELNLDDHDWLRFALTQLEKRVQIYSQAHAQAKLVVRSNLRDLDRQRDLDFSDFRLAIRSQLRHRQSNRQKAAQELYDLSQAYIEMRSKSHSEQSNLMWRFLKALEEKDNRSKLSLLGVMDYYVNLKESQEQFDKAYLKRIEGRSLRKTVTREQARTDLLQAYHQIYRYLLALEYFGKDKSHQEVLGVFNDVRLLIREKVARRTRQHKKNKVQTEPVALLEEPALD